MATGNITIKIQGRISLTCRLSLWYYRAKAWLLNHNAAEVKGISITKRTAKDGTLIWTAGRVKARTYNKGLDTEL